VLRAVPDYADEPCNCPDCAGEQFDPESMLTDLTASAEELASADDPIEAELLAAMFLAAGRVAGAEFEAAFTEGMVPTLAARGDRGALALLAAFDVVRSQPATTRAVRQLIADGVPEPAWAPAARQPLTGGLFRAYRIDDVISMLLCSFERAGQAHGFLLHVDHTDCDAASTVLLIPGDALDQVAAHIPKQAKRDRLSATVEELTPEDFRWEVERALDARAVHDQEDGTLLADETDDEEGPDYHTLAELLRSRMRTLPEPGRPPAAHGGGVSLLDSISLIAAEAQRAENRRLGRRGELKLPPKPKRKKTDGPAPIYRIKVGLRDAKPPIWRRLEVPADITLSRLHRVIQVAFGWHDSHAHVFETPYGEYGVADRELGHRAEGPVTLEQVAPGVKDRFRYVYDFGDNWLHDIEVEAVVDREPSANYPRCTGGRRAAPAEDSGGIGGWADSAAILADPAHPEHEERREWLGLQPAEEFDPARFDPAEITDALAASRRTR